MESKDAQMMLLRKIKDEALMKVEGLQDAVRDYERQVKRYEEYVRKLERENQELQKLLVQKDEALGASREIGAHVVEGFTKSSNDMGNLINDIELMQQYLGSLVRMYRKCL